MTRSAPAQPRTQHHDRATLEAAAERYLEALAAGDPAAAGLAADVVFAENDQPLPVGTASWRTIHGLGRYRHVFADPEAGEVGVIATVVENGQGAIVIVRLKLVDGLVTEAEQFVMRDPNGFEFYEQMGEPDPVWLEPIPQQQRQSREALQAASWMYFQALERNDGAGIYPFRDDCERTEHGRRTVGDQVDSDGYGHADDAVDFMHQKVKAQYELGMMAFVTAARDRRTLAVDVERGAVLGSCFFDFDATLEAIHFADGTTWTIPPYFQTPRSHHMNEAFKVINGSFRWVEMALLEVPHATRPVWGPRPRVQLDYRPSSPPAELVGTDRATLLAQADAVIDALIHNCPHRLPLAPDVAYTENGVAVRPGEGLWKSVRARGGYRVVLADAHAGQAGYVGEVDENGLFTMLAVRVAMHDGLITRIDVVAARPEPSGEWGNLAAATNTMFTSPLLADLDRAGFAEVDAALVRAPQRASARDELSSLVDDYFAAFEARSAALVAIAGHCTRRENGVPASGNAGGPVVDTERPEYGVFAGGCGEQLDGGYLAALSTVRRGYWLADEHSGLVLDVTMFDHAADAERVEVAGVGAVAAAGSFRQPSSDIHASLFKVDRGCIEHIEQLVRRVPYGQALP